MTSKNCVLFFSVQGSGVGGEAGVKRRMGVVVVVVGGYTRWKHPIRNRRKLELSLGYKLTL